MKVDLQSQRKNFEKEKKIYDSALLTFHGVEGYDVYNTSIPFTWQSKRYIFGRVERRTEWARSWVRLFEETGKDDWSLVKDSMIYQLEDPYVAFIGRELVLGGTHVRLMQGRDLTYYGYFYKGTELDDLYYFATGPDYMKDIRLVPMADGRIGVFSRPRSEEIRKKYGSESVIGFTIIDSLAGLTAEAVESAPFIPGILEKDEWGGCNQAYLLDSGLIGVTGHKCYNEQEGEITKQIYMNVAFVFDPKKHAVISDVKIIGTRPCYPEAPAKRPHLTDCAFTSGIVARPDGRVDLYSGIGDSFEGRVTIDYPFEGYGSIVEHS